MHCCRTDIFLLSLIISILEGLIAWMGKMGRGTERTLVEVDIEMPDLGQGEHANEFGIFLLEFLASRLQLLLGELPVTSLSRFPIVGRHGCLAHQAQARHKGVGESDAMSGHEVDELAGSVRQGWKILHRWM
jgi:hypothetical protein